jgi:hypothetical protein
MGIVTYENEAGHPAIARGASNPRPSTVAPLSSRARRVSLGAMPVHDSPLPLSTGRYERGLGKGQLAGCRRDGENQQ